MKRFLRWFGAGFAILVILAIAVPYLIPMEQYKKQLEIIISDATGYPTKIDSIRIKVFPVLAIKAKNVQFTWPTERMAELDEKRAGEQLVVEKATIPLALRKLIQGNVVIPKLTLVDVMADKDFLWEFVESFTSEDDSQVDEEPSSFALHVITARSVKLRLDNGKILGPYNLSLNLEMETGFTELNVSREDQSVQLDVTLDEESIHYRLKATDWENPLGYPVHLESISAEAFQSGAYLIFPDIQAKTFDGKLSGKGTLSWVRDWKTAGVVKFVGVDLKKATSLMDAKSLSGKLDSDCSFLLIAPTVNELLHNPDVSCSYTILDGEIYKADLENAASLTSSKDEEPGSTPFSEFKGNMKLKDDNIVFTDLNLESNALQVSGKLKVEGYTNLSGVLDVGVKKTASLASIPLKISGTVNEPKFRLTNDAIAGGTIGTVILGPGLGTAIGMKIGKGISKLFGGGDDEENEKQ